ncbi:diguanylate cyclase domain-containing protein, partial [Patulibacter sp. S7RM1-6]
MAAVASLVLLTSEPTLAGHFKGDLAQNLPQLLAGPLTACGIMLLSRPVGGAVEGTRLVLDGVLIGCGTSVVVSYLALQPLSAEHYGAAGAPLMAVGYLALDTIALALGLMALLRASAFLRRNILAAVAGLIFLMLGDALRGFELLPPGIEELSASEASWALGIACLAAAVWIPPAREARDRAAPETGWWNVAPYVFVVPVAAVLVASAVRGDLEPAIVVTAAVVIVLLGLRYVLTLSENVALTARLTATVRGLEHRAAHDELTGLLNRTGLIRRLEVLREEQEEGRLSSVGLVFIDIDRFKGVNDTLGHAAGDAVLRAVAERLRTVVARDGG